jgi:hypothetical protein
MRGWSPIGALLVAVLVAGAAAGWFVGDRQGGRNRSFTPWVAASSCGRAVIRDWYDNGRVDRLYPNRCYREAIATLPAEQLTRRAHTAIDRALSYARSGRADPTPVTVARIRAGSSITLAASRARPGDWVTCVKQGNRVRARVQQRGRGVGLSSDGLTFSATLDLTTSASGRVVVHCR